MLQYKKIKYILVLALIFAPIATASLPFIGATPVQAAITEGGGGGGNGSGGDECVEIGIGVPGVEDNCVENGEGDNNPIFVYLRGIIQFLAVGVGLAVAIGIVVAGIQYMASRGNPQSTAAAIQRLWNAIIALVLFIFMAAIINFLIPGGLL